MIINMNLQTFLKERVDSGESQSSIARQTGVSQSTINNIIHGAENPSMTTLKKIAAAYHQQVSLFVSEEDAPEYGPAPRLTDKERRLLLAFRNLDERRQDRFLDTIEDMVLALRESYAKGGSTSGSKGTNYGQSY